MGKQPSAIIIVRHGTRLDQADKTWRATAEHPYDPPLSYGGWIQCQTLGARIDKELQNLNDRTPDDLKREEDGEIDNRPRKKRKLIIHSSPYKRCIQTSIALAAGLRYPQPEQLRPLPTPYQRSALSNHRPSPATPTSNGQSDPNQPATETIGKNARDGKLLLKIDPFLGEWLSPGYFEDTKPPPTDGLIVERARDTLTRPIQEIRGADLSAFLPVPESPETEDADREHEYRQNAQEKGGLRAMAAAGHSLTHRTRTASSTVDRSNLHVQKLRQRARTLNVYQPPVPQYSLAPQDPIPAGYVAHARDQCVDSDLNWNSEEMGWGDAGVYPEEWSTMHVRFRQGLQQMLAYYQDPEHSHSSDDEDEDSILVLVTHQAGANALIRLVTGAPALHDVGVASLTLAVRRPVLRRLPSLTGTSHSPLGYDRESRRNSRRGSLDLGLADDFEMRIIASTEHLRQGSNPLGLNSPRMGKSPAMPGRRMLGTDSLESLSLGDPLAWHSAQSRSASQRGRTSDLHSNRPSPNTGLWGSPSVTPASHTPIKEDLADLEPMSPKSRPSTPSVETDSVPESKLSSPGSRSRSSTVQSTGLWGNSTTTTTTSSSSFSSHPSLTVRSASGESNMWGGSATSSSGGNNGGQVSRARSPAKRRWTAVSSSP